MRYVRVEYIDFGAYIMIFVTVGSQKFQFNRLLEKIDEMIDLGVITESVFAQIGYCDYKPRNYPYVDFLDREEFAAKLDECQTVITHGGTGVIIGAVKKGKKVISVPRLAKYGEHVDDHQCQILKQFDATNIIMACYDLDELPEYYTELPTATFRPYFTNTHVLIESIEEYLSSIDGD